MTTEGEEIHAERRSLQSTEEDDCFLKFEKGQWLVEEKLVHRVNVSRNPM